MTFAFFRDEDGWGLGLTVAALNKGLDARLFDDDESLAACPADSVLFVRMSHKDAYRSRYKERLEVWGRLHKTVPGRQMAKLYDDKIAQQELLGQYMPQAFVVKNEEDAYMAMRWLKMPFVSKSYSGAGSKGVKLISSSDEAIKDLNLRVKAEGPLVWQHFCTGNEHDYRCLIVGKERLWLKRINRADTPFASGSGNIVPLRCKDVPKKMTDFAEQIAEDSVFSDSPMPFAGIDLIYCDGQPKITEVTTSWTLPGYFGAEWMDGRKGHAFFDVLVEQMEAACRQ